MVTIEMSERRQRLHGWILNGNQTPEEVMQYIELLASAGL